MIPLAHQDTIRFVHLASPEGWERSFTTRWAAKLVEVRNGAVMRRASVPASASSRPWSQDGDPDAPTTATCAGSYRRVRSPARP